MTGAGELHRIVFGHTGHDVDVVGSSMHRSDRQLWSGRLRARARASHDDRPARSLRYVAFEDRTAALMYRLRADVDHGNRADRCRVLVGDQSTLTWRVALLASTWAEGWEPDGDWSGEHLWPLDAGVQWPSVPHGWTHPDTVRQCRSVLAAVLSARLREPGRQVSIACGPGQLIELRDRAALLWNLYTVSDKCWLDWPVSFSTFEDHHESGERSPDVIFVPVDFRRVTTYSVQRSVVDEEAMAAAATRADKWDCNGADIVDEYLRTVERELAAASTQKLSLQDIEEYRRQQEDLVPRGSAADAEHLANGADPETAYQWYRIPGHFVLPQGQAEARPLRSTEGGAEQDGRDTDDSDGHRGQHEDLAAAPTGNGETGTNGSSREIDPTHIATLIICGRPGDALVMLRGLKGARCPEGKRKPLHKALIRHRFYVGEISPEDVRTIVRFACDPDDLANWRLVARLRGMRLAVGSAALDELAKLERELERRTSVGQALLSQSRTELVLQPVTFAGRVYAVLAQLAMWVFRKLACVRVTRDSVAIGPPLSRRPLPEPLTTVLLLTAALSLAFSALVAVGVPNGWDRLQGLREGTPGAAVPQQQPPQLLELIRAQHLYVAAQGDYQIVINLAEQVKDPQLGWPAYYIAAGTVAAQVNFDALPQHDVIVNQQDRTVQVRIPAPLPLRPVSDPSRVYYVPAQPAEGPPPRSVPVGINDQVIRALDIAAGNSDLLVRATQNAKALVRALVQAAGYQVTFVDGP